MYMCCVLCAGQCWRYLYCVLGLFCDMFCSVTCFFLTKDVYVMCTLCWLVLALFVVRAGFVLFLLLVSVDNVDR